MPESFTGFYYSILNFFEYNIISHLHIIETSFDERGDSELRIFPILFFPLFPGESIISSLFYECVRISIIHEKNNLTIQRERV
jgi:hypothetical protein